MNVAPGDLAEVIDSVDGLMVGRIVEVLYWAGEHSRLGTIWTCHCKDELVTEYGGVGNEADFADGWLRKIEPPQVDEDIAVPAELEHP